MQHSSHFQTSPYIQRDTSVSTKQQIQPYLSNPFLLTHSQQLNTENERVQSKISWTNKEKLQYLIFICYFRDFFNNLSFQSLEWNVFRAMAKFIVSKNPQQCRSYHFKVIRVFKGVRMFLRLCIKRVSKMREMLVNAQGGLQAIQEEFDIYVDKIHQVEWIEVNDQIIVNTNNNKRLANNSQLIVSEQKSIRIQKHQHMKTADNYYHDEQQQQQNSVKNNNNSSNKNINLTKVQNDEGVNIITTAQQQQERRDNNSLQDCPYFTMLNEHKRFKQMISKQSLPSFLVYDDDRYCERDIQTVNNSIIQNNKNDQNKIKIVRQVNETNQFRQLVQKVNNQKQTINWMFFNVNTNIDRQRSTLVIHKNLEVQLLLSQRQYQGNKQSNSNFNQTNVLNNKNTFQISYD